MWDYTGPLERWLFAGLLLFKQSLSGTNKNLVRFDCVATRQKEGHITPRQMYNSPEVLDDRDSNNLQSREAIQSWVSHYMQLSAGANTELAITSSDRLWYLFFHIFFYYYIVVTLFVELHIGWNRLRLRLIMMYVSSKVTLHFETEPQEASCVTPTKMLECSTIGMQPPDKQNILQDQPKLRGRGRLKPKRALQFRSESFDRNSRKSCQLQSPTPKHYTTNNLTHSMHTFDISEFCWRVVHISQ